MESFIHTLNAPTPPSHPSLVYLQTHTHTHTHTHARTLTHTIIHCPKTQYITGIKDGGQHKHRNANCRVWDDNPVMHCSLRHIALHSIQNTMHNM